jgi:uncharacterized membrane protein YjfL (UPF0719 family)
MGIITDVIFWGVIGFVIGLIAARVVDHLVYSKMLERNWNDFWNWYENRKAVSGNNGD